ncbi:MAG: putative porin [Bacteroidales bacterium]|nr:putative porin [Bacteroidales bacterium]
MKKGIARIWFPVLVVIVAAVQTFGMDLARNGEVLEALRAFRPAPDTVIYDNSAVFTKFRKAGDKAAADSLEGFAEDSLAAADTTPVLTARDTIHAPDSLRETDPFRYKYYVALVDSLTHQQVRDSLRAAGDSLDWPKLDSIYFADSALLAKKKFEEWYNSLSKEERKRYDLEQRMKREMRQADSIYRIKDSLQAIKDSIRENTPRILSTFAVPDSMFYKRIFTWNKDPLFNEIRYRDLDTNYNYYFNDYPFLRNDVMASYLGIAGSPVQHFDWFKRRSQDGVTFFTPYEEWTYSPSTLPMYNTKTPYTELAYWGTLFANTEEEEANLHIMTTQNILPQLNLMLEYDRFGGNGMLLREDTDNRTAVVAANWLGEKYAAHGGFIHNKVIKSENGGVHDPFWIRDTTVSAREIAVNLNKAANTVRKNTFFLDQTLRIPFTFLKEFDLRKEIRADKAYRDSVTATGDSTAIAQMEEYLAGREKEREIARQLADTLDTDVTTAFIGHNSELSFFSKTYTDVTTTGTEAAYFADFFNNQFYLNPSQSMDSLRVMKLDNKVFLKLQPWSSDAIVSRLNVGVGDRLLNYYLFSPDQYLKKTSNTVWNSLYLYAGAEGRWRGFNWDANGYYTFLGNEINDFGIFANAAFSFYPFRRYRKSPITVQAHFETTLDEPDFYLQHFLSNHYKWENGFGKISTTRVDGQLDIPRWKLSVEAGYALLGNNIYFDTQALPQQYGSAMSVFKAGLRKEFQMGIVHLDNRLLAQYSTNAEVLPLPPLALNLKWFIQFKIAKVMDMQLGVNGLYTLAWNAPAYNPVLGVFHNQVSEKYSNGPYFDVFANIQWKRACIFVKLVNAGMGWPMTSVDYFSAHGYILPQRGVKFGIYWPFYIQPHKNESVSGRAGSGIGGGGGGGMSGGMGGGLRGLTSGMR